MAPRAEVPRASNFKRLDCQTRTKTCIDPKRGFSAVSNRSDLLAYDGQTWLGIVRRLYTCTFLNIDTALASASSRRNSRRCALLNKPDNQKSEARAGDDLHGLLITLEAAPSRVADRARERATAGRIGY